MNRQSLISGARQPRFLAGLLAGAVLASLIGALVMIAGRDNEPASTPTAAPAVSGDADSTPVVDAASTAEPEPEAEPESEPPADTTSEPSPEQDGTEGQGEPVTIALATIRVGTLPSGAKVTCPKPTVRVRDAKGLHKALAAARPGTTIALADGRYQGNFVARAAGNARRPIFLCGGPGAILDGGGVKKGYVLHLNGANYWRVVGFTVRNGQKGVMVDGSAGSVIQDLTVSQIGDEAIHLRSGSTGNAVLSNRISHTGLRRAKFGEGIYIGSAVSNWGTYSSGKPDRSDFNLVQGNVISNTKAESIDIKEGTTGGAVVGNTFDGTGMTGADSWVDVKGNGWLIRGNLGRNTPKDGFQTHHITGDWGSRNVFTGNTAHLGRGGGRAFYIHDPDSTENVVRCDNKMGDGGRPTGNVDCSG